jgi:hypothetical protein
LIDRQLVPSVGATNSLKIGRYLGTFVHRDDGVMSAVMEGVIMKSKLLGLMAVIGLLGLFPSAGHALNFSFSFTGSCNVGPGCTATVTGEIDGLTNGTSAATAVIIDSISNAAFTLPSPLPFNTTNCGSNCLLSVNTFTVIGGVLTAEDYDASSDPIITGDPPFEGLWNLSLGSSGPGEMAFANGTTPFDCHQPCADFQDSIISQSGATFTPLTGATPLPAALPLFATGLGAMGLFGWRRKRKNDAAVAAA